MHVVRLNDLDIEVRNNTVFVMDVFNDTTPEEVHTMVRYLVNEGFINQNETVSVFVKSRAFMRPKKEVAKKQKKN